METCAQAVADVFDGATVLVGGFGDAGVPGQLLEALRVQGARNLVIATNGSGTDDFALGGLFTDNRVRKLIASFANNARGTAFKERYLKGEVELELLPQGTLVERMRAAGAGLGGFYSPTAFGTDLAAGKETRVIDGRSYVFEPPLHADFAFIKAYRSDRLGNLTYRYAMRNFNPIMATAAKTVVVEVDELVGLGEIAPENVHTPGIFVDRVVRVERHPRLFNPRKKGQS